MSQSSLLPAHVQQYVVSHSLREPELLQRLRLETASHPMARMQTAPEQGQLLALLVQAMQARRVLEVGVFTGYSSLIMALALPPEGRIVACDVSEEYTATARRYWAEAGVTGRVDLRIGPASETLQKLLVEGAAGTFDFAYIDADKVNYPVYYDLALALLRPGGVVAVDNVLQAGKVADADNHEANTIAIREFNRKVHADERVHVSFLPIADGLTLALKR